MCPSFLMLLHEMVGRQDFNWTGKSLFCFGGVASSRIVNYATVVFSIVCPMIVFQHFGFNVDARTVFVRMIFLPQFFAAVIVLSVFFLLQ